MPHDSCAASMSHSFMSRIVTDKVGEKNELLPVDSPELNCSGGEVFAPRAASAGALRRATGLLRPKPLRL